MNDLEEVEGFVVGEPWDSAAFFGKSPNAPTGGINIASFYQIESCPGD